MEALKKRTGCCKADVYIHIHRIGHLLDTRSRR